VKEAARPSLLVLTSSFPRWAGDPSSPFVLDLCLGLAREFAVTVVAPRADNSLAAESFGDVEVQRYEPGWPVGPRLDSSSALTPQIKARPVLNLAVPPFVGRQFARARALARERDFAAVHAHWAIPQGTVAAAIKATSGLPFVTTCHGADIYGFSGRLPRALKRWSLRRSDAVTVVSRALGDEVEALGVEQDKLHVMPMGVDTSLFSPNARSSELRRRRGDGPLILFVGRLSPKKGVPHLIDAAPEILRAIPETTILIVGDGPCAPELKEQATRLGLQEKVVFEGAVAHDALPSYFASADVFVAPSIVAPDGDTEGLSVVVLEAMASGCPVVATDVGGIDEALKDGETGLIIPAGDSAALAEAVVRLLTDRAEANVLATRAISAIARFDLDNVVTRYAELIRSVMRGGEPVRQGDGS
jgi:glycosyltransferase involved in cell wall biosynthesis